MAGQNTEVTYRTTGDCSIELGTPKEGRMKLYFSDEEVANVEQAHQKIDNVSLILDYARQQTTLKKTGKAA